MLLFNKSDSVAMEENSDYSYTDSKLTDHQEYYQPANGVTKRFDVVINRSRDNLLTDFSKATLENQYLLPGESYQDVYARVASYFSDNPEHAQRIYDYISLNWFMPSTPIIANGGTKRGLPISCFLNEASDSLDGIVDLWNENVWLASKGGGIGSYWGNLRSLGEKVGMNGKTSGIMPFVKVMDSLTLAISQGSLRRGAAAVYLQISHPEIEEFIEMRRSTGGDPKRKSTFLHHGILVSDAFMRAVDKDEQWSLLSPKDSKVVRKISARDLWIRILNARIEMGEPYIVFIDRVKEQQPEHHKLAGLEVKTSNLCSEITLPTGLDHKGKERTAVCCLSSLNLEKFFEWENHPTFVKDVMLFLDNILQDFIDNAPDKGFARAKYAAMRERSVGLGVMGFHSFLQMQGIPFEGAMAKSWNYKIFKLIRMKANAASIELANSRGPCPDAEEFGIMERFSHKLSIAPTASISIITGACSPGIEPIAANSFLQKTLAGSFTVRNRHLKKVLKSYNMDTDEVWSGITTAEGSVQHLDFLTQTERDTYKTAFELDQRWVIELAADRTQFICQSQSVNIFLPGNVSKNELVMLHRMAWSKGMKSLYYCRSLSIQRADTVSRKLKALPAPNASADTLVIGEEKPSPYSECLACQ
jgi:ribonucleoside-diphosphate reductase alpha chain